MSKPHGLNVVFVPWAASPGLTEWYPTFLVRFAEMPESMSTGLEMT